MYLTKYSRSVVKSKSFSPASLVKTSAFFKEISNEPLQKSKPVSESHQKADGGSPQVDSSPYREAGPKRKPDEEKRLSPEDRARASRSEGFAEGSPTESLGAALTSPDSSLVQKRDPSEMMVHADPFEEVPGPVLLKKIAGLWKYLPEIGCQATVSAMLSFFHVGQRLAAITKIGRTDSRPFDRLFRKYGPIVMLQGPLGSDIVIINKPEHVTKVYEQEGKHPVRSTLDSIEKCRSAFRKSCRGPFNLTGDEWEEMRRALQEPLARGGEKYFQAIEEAAEMFVRRIRSVRNRQNEVPVDFMVEVTKWSMECMCFVTLGKSLGFHGPDPANSSSEPVRILKALIEATQNICKCESGFQLWRFINTPSSVGLTQACEVLDAIVSKHVRLAQVNLTRSKEEILSGDKSGERKKSLSFIENLLLNECLSPDEVLTCIVDLLILGVNTTSSALAFSLYYLAQNQRAQRRLFGEVREILPEKRSPLEHHHLTEMKYLEACISETLRLRMPMPTLTRILPADVCLSNFRIPKGTYMVMDVQSACLREQNFEKSDKFVPERWLEPSNVQPFSFIPYGHGARSCLGKNLAQVQLKSCISKIVRNFQIEYNYGEIRGTKTVISFPDSPLKLSFIEREI